MTVNIFLAATFRVVADKFPNGRISRPVDDIIRSGPLFSRVHFYRAPCVPPEFTSLPRLINALKTSLLTVAVENCALDDREKESESDERARARSRITRRLRSVTTLRCNGNFAKHHSGIINALPVRPYLPVFIFARRPFKWQYFIPLLSRSISPPSLPPSSRRHRRARSRRRSPPCPLSRAILSD